MAALSAWPWATPSARPWSLQRRDEILRRFPPHGISELVAWGSFPRAPTTTHRCRWPRRAGYWMDARHRLVGAAHLGRAPARAPAKEVPRGRRAPDLDALTAAVWTRYLAWLDSARLAGSAPGDTCLAALRGGRAGSPRTA